MLDSIEYYYCLILYRQYSTGIQYGITTRTVDLSLRKTRTKENKNIRLDDDSSTRLPADPMNM
jgi:hypothetical protein